MTRTPDRTGPQGWQAKWPLSKVAVVLIAFVLGVGTFTCQEFYIWTPLQRWYFNEYSLSHDFPTTRFNYWLLMKTDRNGYHSVAGNSDVVPDFRGRHYLFPFELSDQARQQGAVQLNLETVHYNSAEMERILRGEIFAGRSVGELIFPSCAASFGFLVIGLAFAIPRDRARRRQEMKEQGSKDHSWLQLKNSTDGSFVLLLNTRYLPTDSYKHHSHYPGLILVEDNPRLGTRERRLQPNCRAKRRAPRCA